jgi:hypothetical protein
MALTTFFAPVLLRASVARADLACGIFKAAIYRFGEVA